MQENIKGVILKTMDYKEKDKLMWVFTEQYGKISVICKAVRSPKNKYQSLIRPLLFGDFQLYRGKTMYSFNEGMVISSFSKLSTSLELLTYGSYYVELIDIVAFDGDAQPDLYETLVSALYLLESEAIEMSLLTLAYEVKILSLTGIYVGREAIPFKISERAVNIIEFLKKTPLPKIQVLKLDETTIKEVKTATSYLMNESFQRKPKSLKFLEYM
ncbi:MAG: DNA repair protein RecO [Clostridium sp.]|nr:DNA repair protein RecO [Clostridium sp.]